MNERMKTEGQVQTNQSRADNFAYVNDTAIKIRLNTEPLLAAIWEFLSGEREIYTQEQDGTVRIEIKQVGLPKANKMGIQAIMQRITMIINASCVQGNYDKERYAMEIGQVRRSLRDEILINIEDYAMKEGDIEPVIDSIMTMVKAFLSRLIDNLERVSYDQSLRMVETSSQKIPDKRRFLGFIGGG